MTGCHIFHSSVGRLECTLYHSGFALTMARSSSARHAASSDLLLRRMLETSLKAMLTALPLVAELHHPAMRPRHWQQLMKVAPALHQRYRSWHCLLPGPVTWRVFGACCIAHALLCALLWHAVKDSRFSIQTPLMYYRTSKFHHTGLAVTFGDDSSSMMMYYASTELYKSSAPFTHAFGRCCTKA